MDYLMVIFRNYDLLDVQRKQFSRLFNESDYKFIIFDNTPPAEKREIIPRSNEHVLFRDSIGEFDGVSHGSAIDYGLQHVGSDVVCILDSDFFILNKGIHSYVNKKIDEGYDAVGAEYNTGLGVITNLIDQFPSLFDDIPCCFCGYYKTELARSNSWVIHQHEIDHNTSYIEVGWRIRKHIVDNGIKTTHWKARFTPTNSIFEDDGIIMGVHNVAGSHLKVHRTQDQIINDITGDINDFNFE